jgi:hypothetical protein
MNHRLPIGETTVAKSKSSGGEKVTQKQMVQTALQEKGWDAGPRELQEVIKEKFNYDMAVNYISNYKSQLKKEGGMSTGRKRGRKGGPQFADLETVRGLVDRLGAEQVKKLVDVANMFA